MANELEPCPFCGCTDQLSLSPSSHACSACHATASLMSREVPGTWNTRPIEDSLRAEVERLKAELSRYTGPLTGAQAAEIAYRCLLTSSDVPLVDAAIRAARGGKP